MFDKEYFSSLLKETMELINKKERTKIDNQKIKYNTKTLMILLDGIKDESKRARYASKIEKNLNLKLEDKKVKTKEEKVNLINKDILNFSKQLKQRVTTFNRMLEEDKDVVRSVESNYSEQMVKTESNIKNIQKSEEFSVRKGFITVIIIFIVMYVFIRTF